MKTKVPLPGETWIRWSDALKGRILRIVVGGYMINISNRGGVYYTFRSIESIREYWKKA